MKLGVNIDHVAVLREARRVNDPDILEALFVACSAGADQITIHLREDRRHIHDDDAFQIAKLSKVPLNLECSIDEEIISVIQKITPHRATLVPEKREEVTTEGGLDLHANKKAIKKAIKKLVKKEIAVSLFIDPDLETIALAKELGADMIELHTGHYANTFAMLHSNLPHSRFSVKELELSRQDLHKELQNSLAQLEKAAQYAYEIGLEVAAGHGLNYQNVTDITAIKQISELNIGQSIVARSVFVGLKEAIKEMKELVCKR